MGRLWRARLTHKLRETVAVVLVIHTQATVYVASVLDRGVARAYVEGIAKRYWAEEVEHEEPEPPPDPPNVVRAHFPGGP